VELDISRPARLTRTHVGATELLAAHGAWATMRRATLPLSCMP
jgi:hypothetical protein